MFDNITREQFRVDTVLPAIQTASAFAVAQVAGRLNHYSVSAQSTVVLSFTASLLASLANNFFAKAIYQYLAIPVSVAASLVVHRFITGKELDAVGNIKEIAIISTVLLAVKLVADNLHRLKKAEEKVVDAAKKDIAAAEVAVLDKADKALKAADDKVVAEKDKLEKK